MREYSQEYQENFSSDHNRYRRSSSHISGERDYGKTFGRTSVLLVGDVAHLLNVAATLLYRICGECSEENDLYERFQSRINWDSTEITEEEVRSDIEEAIQDMIDRGILSREQTALVNDREEIEDITDYIVYVKPRVDTFSVGELMNFVQEMATTSAHGSHCYTKFA